MPTSYGVRLYNGDPLLIPLHVQVHSPLRDVYGVSALLRGWCAGAPGSPDPLTEQLASFTDPDGAHHISNIAAFSCLVGDPGTAPIQRVTHVGLMPSMYAGALPLSGFARQTAPITSVALPGGAKDVSGRVTFAPGALVFTLPS